MSSESAPKSSMKRGSCGGRLLGINAELLDDDVFDLLFNWFVAHKNCPGGCRSLTATVKAVPATKAQVNEFSRLVNLISHAQSSGTHKCAGCGLLHRPVGVREKTDVCPVALLLICSI